MGLVTAKEVAKAIKADKYGIFGTFTSWLLMRALKISTLNKIYDRNKHLSNLDFINSILEEFEIDFEIDEEDLKRLPKNGPYITISNHPLGGVDGILLLKLMLEHDPNFKIIANFLLRRIEPLKPYILPVNPFENHRENSSIVGIKETLMHLREGKSLGIFPAGEVSTYKDGALVVDKPWEEGAIKLLKKANVPIVPIYFHAKNSKLFYFLSKIDPTLRTAKLPSELLTQKKRVIKIRIGRAISVEDQNEYKDLQEFGIFLRFKTYLLSKSYKRNKKKKLIKIPSFKFNYLKSVEPIIEEIPKDKMSSEVETLRTGNRRLLESKNYEVFLCKSDEIPNILREIGRLREITFREIGEGTNKSMDLDKYDEYYHHMFLWDNKSNRIAGAYRMGLGQKIFKSYGIDGFYLSELFNFDSELYPMFGKSIEMGRAFIIKEYQQKPLPLFLLWKGIIHTTLRYPEHEYLIGGVSISNEFTHFSKSLMIEFMRSHYFDPFIAQYVKPKKEFKVKLKDVEKDLILGETDSDLNKFDKIIEDLEPNKLRVPVLIKKYIKQNAKVIAFNVDPLFNNSLDGLMYIKIKDLPESTVRPVLEEFEAELKNNPE